jgi:hypothetical protein
MVRRKLKIFYQFKIFGNPSRAPAAHAVFRNFSVDFRKEKSNIALCRIICFRTVEKPVFRSLIRFGAQVTKTYINGNGVDSKTVSERVFVRTLSRTVEKQQYM